MPRLLALCASCCASALTALAVECPRWISVMPLNADNVEAVSADAAQLGNETVVDGVAWSFAVHPEGDPVTDKAALYADRYRRMEPLVRKSSAVKVGILMQATMGHGGLPGSPANFQRVVYPDGRSIYRMCPLDRGFLDYIARTCRTFSALKPDFFMVDDDTRLTLDKETPGCFCPLHLAEFAKRTGREWTREQVVEAFAADPAVREKWLALMVDSLSGLFRTIRENYGESVPGILCVCAHKYHMGYARRYAEILAAPGQKPVVRGNGAPFHNYGKDVLHTVEMRSRYADSLARLGEGAVLMQEADTCPHTLWMSSATRLVDHMVMLALDGVKGAKIWITRTGNYHERRSGQAYRRAFRENRGLMKWADEADFRQAGVVVPACGPQLDNFGDLYLGLTGIPYRFGKARPGEITALTAATLELLPRDEIAAILSGRVIVDGTGANWLAAHGFADDLGAEAKPWARKTIQVHEFADGSRQAGLRVNPSMADLTALKDGAKVLSKLFNRPNMGADPVYEAPGAILFENARGGRIVALAQPLPTAVPISYAQTLLSESYKKWIVGLLAELGGGLPGGVCYLGDGPVTCLAGTTEKDGRIVVLNMLDLDGDDAPELAFDRLPSKVERLRGNGTWENVKFTRTGGSAIRLATKVETQRPAIFRIEHAVPCPWVSQEERDAVSRRTYGIEIQPGTPEGDAKRFYTNPEKTEYVEFNYDEEKAGEGTYTLEDPLAFADGRKVRSPADWPSRRREILELFEREVYGRLPPKPDEMVFDLVSEKLSEDRFALVRTYRQYFRADRTGPVIDWIVVVPRQAKEKAPVFLHLNYAGLESIAAKKTNHYDLPWDMMVANGYAFMSAKYTQITSDCKDGKDGTTAFNGVCELWGKRDPKAMDNPGALIVWAWGLMRGLDLAERIGEIDATRNVVIGSSRLGKAALLAAAYDERFTVCIPNQTGAVGVQLMKRDYGESLKGQHFSLPHWYCRNVWKYEDDPKSQPFDQHMLLACVAPRALLLECYHKKWFDPKGEFLAAKAASPVWEFLTGRGLGLEEMPPPYDDSFVRPPFGYVRRTECHGLSPYDWKWAIDFANRAFGR